MNTKDLQTIENADFSDDTHTDKVCKEMRDIVKERTDDYKSPENLSDVKIDMTDTIKTYGYDVDLYKQKFGSVQRSELQAAENLLQLAKDKGGSPTTTRDSDDGDKAKRKRKIKIKLKLQLQLAEN